MSGYVRLTGESAPRRVRLELRARAERVLLPHRTTDARLTGRVRIEGCADDTGATGLLEISPLARRRIRYRIRFTAEDGRRLVLDGWKSVRPARPVHSMTVLPFSLEGEEVGGEGGEGNEDGDQVGRGELRFPLTTGLLPFLASFRFPVPQDLFAPRWKGEPGRTEVWYTTVTDPVTGTGLWLHHELTAPSDGSPARAHGWVAVYPREGSVEHARFGPVPFPGPRLSGPTPTGFAAAGVEAGPAVLRGSAEGIAWDLVQHPGGEPVYTFPRWSWRRPLLPAAQIVPAPTSAFTGLVRYNGRDLRLEGAPGATARVYGHGNAHRWAWLHADLGGGDVLEVVAAVSTRPGLRALPPLVFLRLRKDGRTWPRRAERSAVGWAGLGRFRASIGLPGWAVLGRAGLRRILVEVTQPPERTLALDYTDPDGGHAVCRNSETADAVVLLERWWGHWRTEAEWTLHGTAHAEVGDR